MAHETRLEDLIGLEHTKLGFFKEVQIKIRELQESNLQLEQKQQQIQGILDGITDVMAVISPDFRIVSVNPVFFEIFRHDAPLGEYCYRVFREKNRPCTPCPMKDALRKNDVCRRMVIYSIDGQNRQFEITASPLRNAQGVLQRILLLKRDVTVEKEYQAKYYHAEKMATIGLLAAGVAHEINNPLTAISGFAEGLKRRIPKLEKRLSKSQADRNMLRDFQEYIQTIMSECDRCRDIVQNLLTFSPREKVSFSAIDLNALVVDILKILDNQLKKKLPKAICLDLGEPLPRPKGVAAELKQVVLNLVLNALYAIQEKGKITLRTYTEEDQWIVLSVEDTGCGIRQKDLDKLFEPFFTTKPVGKGIGIGLSTCYNIIRQHGGEIVVKSEYGEGSEFKVKFPKKM
ncbi:PAS domain-containing sensor histidine kinase [Desulfonema ishimotonii]|uniref:histidine kinase n=1 Tax=Desulfonema ishimotonii TaxID=45657 RepID=A0A401FRA8_9BACT|nr:ATP-binding protein [Desulfonema ishimotonii]GBC59502.1 PAS domain-containing sensor histidine kinase [Desulfonema ishimotonii]